ncbi:MAG: DnaJ domain-containing protein [Thermoanaerobaculia bacterium]
MAKDYYLTLGVSRNATQDQIRERFRMLARDRHPDRFQGAERQKAEGEFQAITEAFNVLSDAERRRQHDVELSRPEASTAANDASRLGRFHMEAGVQFYRDGNFAAAADSFERAIQAEPKNHQAWHHLAQSLAHQRRHLARAVEAIARACDLQAMNGSYLKLAGRLHAEAGLVEKAEHYYNEAMVWGGEDAAVVKALEELRGGTKKGWTGLFGKGT